MKKYIANLIIGVAALTVVAALFIFLDRQPEHVAGDSETGEKSLKMVLSGDGSFYTVTGIGTYEGADVVIPAEYKGVPVREIGRRAFGNAHGVTSVEIPDGVEAIREGAFRDTQIAEIALPESVKIVEGYAFANCKKLEKAVLPTNIEALGEHLFDGCEKLTEVTLPVNLKEIPERIFSDCTHLKKAVTPDGVEKIGAGAFFNCNSLNEANIPGTVKIISDDAFCMTRIEAVTLPDCLEEIGKSAFSGCPLAEIMLPESLRKIGSRAFRNTCLKTARIPANVSEIGFGVFSGKYPFSDNPGIRDVTVDAENPVFYSVNGCIVKRESAELIFVLDPAGVPTDGSIKTVGEFAYSDVDADVAAIPEGVTELKSYAVSDFKRLGEIVLPASLQKMGRSAVSATDNHMEAVEKITFCGTAAQWAAMDRDEEWLGERDKVVVVEVGVNQGEVNLLD